jgi:lipid-binding SYLF domain-containing protein
MKAPWRVRAASVLLWSRATVLIRFREPSALRPHAPTGPERNGTMIGWMRTVAAAGFFAAATLGAGQAAVAASAAEIDAKVDIALDSLLADSAAARAVSEDAVAVLVFPEIVKAGFGIGGQFGEGALRRDGVTTGYFNLASASFGLQIGAQSYAQVLFFMTEEALAGLEQVRGFELGADASVAVADQGLGVDVSTNTVRDPIVAFVFGQKGLMGGVTVEGSKITRINP